MALSTGRLLPLFRGLKVLFHRLGGAVASGLLFPEKTAPTGDSANEITPSAHEIMAVIAPWTEPFLAYLTRQELPEDQNEARCIVRRSKAYKVHEGELYKKSTNGVLQRCISEEEGQNLLAEIHAGLGGHHAAARSLVGKAFRTGFYWPTARADAQDLVQRCVGCQLFANQSHMPPTALKTIPITWPFAVWGLDMVGPLKGGTHKHNRSPSKVYLQRGGAESPG